MKSSQQGITLIELIVVMIVISVALVGVMSVINYTTRHSADPVLRHQAIAIAESYMEKITLNDYANIPDDYSDPGARNHAGELVDALQNYHIDVAVSTSADWNGVAAKKIDVTVTTPAGEEITLTSYRTNY